MKYIIIPYIALGFVLSLAIGVEYTCVGDEVFPKYYGSPIVFMRTSLSSSLEYYYSVSGLVSNVLIWSLLISLSRSLLLKYFEILKLRFKKINILYSFFVVILIAYSSFNIAIHNVFLGKGFDKYSNYWYLEMDKEAEKWGMDCDGYLIFLEM